MIELKSAHEIELLEYSNLLVADTLCYLKNMIGPGITTREIDRIAEKRLRRAGATPAFKGYEGFPATLCTSINDEIVHGIPSSRALREGDIISIDLGALMNGYFGDAAITVAVGVVSERIRQLIDVTEEALYAGIEAAVPGNRINDISRAVQEVAESAGFSVIREFVGHGIGRKLHEPPQIPNYYDPRCRTLLRPGMVIAIEPMINEGGEGCYLKSDRWTAVTADRGYSAHFEHTIAVTEGCPRILSRMECYQRSREWNVC